MGSLSSGGLPHSLEILGGATLTIVSSGQTTYNIDFDVTGVTYNGVFLNTISGDPYSLNDPAAFVPYGASDGVLKLIDMSYYNAGITLLNYFYSSGVTIMTGSTGSARVNFTVPVQPLYDFKLLYQTFNGTLSNTDDIIDPYPVSFPYPGYLPNKLFQCASQNITQLGSTYASVALSGLRYNDQVLETVGTIIVYKNLNNTGGSSGPVSQVSGITLGTYSGFFNGSKTITVNDSGITFDSNLGDYYMIFSLEGTGYTGPTGTSSNYVALNPINLPVDATTVYDTSNPSGVTIATLSNLTYNFTRLNPGDSVGISQAGGPIVRRSVTPQRNVTFAAVNARRSSQLFFMSAGGTYSALSYSTPVYQSVPEVLTATYISRQAFPKTSDGFTFDVLFDYTDADGVSVFDKGHTGTIQVTGGTGMSTFSQTISCDTAGLYKVTVDRGLPALTKNVSFSFSFFDSTLGITRTATSVVTLFWLGMVTTPEKMTQSAIGFPVSTDVFRYTIDGFNYYDSYGYSIFEPNYIQRSQTTGVTFLPYSTVSNSMYQGSTFQGATLVNITSVGNYFFSGLTGSALPFIKGSTISGVSGPNSFGGRVVSSTLSGVVVDCTTFSTPASSSTWTLNGSAYSYVSGHTGTIVIKDVAGTTYATKPWVYGVSSYSGVATGPSGTSSQSGSTLFNVYFYDATMQQYKSDYLSFSLIKMPSGESGASGSTGYGLGGNPGSRAAGSANTAFSLAYMYKGQATADVEYQIEGEVNTAITADYSATLNVPASDMSRMFIYQSAWNVVDPATGQALQGYLGSGTGQPGVTLLDPVTGVQVTTNGSSDYYGPHVALLLGSVLDNIQLSTGSNTYVTKARLTNLDNKLSGVTSTADFSHDGSGTIKPIAGVYALQTFAGASGSTIPSVLSLIPTESISSITTAGLSITTLKSLLVDIDTKTAAAGATYVPALHNLFEEAVSYNKVDDSVPISVSGSGFSAFYNGSGITGGDSTIANSWNNGRNTFGVTFAPNDTIVLYFQYAMSKGRKYQIDPYVTQGLDPTIFQVGQLLSLTIKGTNITIPLGVPGSANSWYTESNSEVIYKTLSLTLKATADDTTSLFD